MKRGKIQTSQEGEGGGLESYKKSRRVVTTCPILLRLLPSGPDLVQAVTLRKLPGKKNIVQKTVVSALPCCFFASIGLGQEISVIQLLLSSKI